MRPATEAEIPSRGTTHPFRPQPLDTRIARHERHLEPPVGCRGSLPKGHLFVHIHPVKERHSSRAKTPPSPDARFPRVILPRSLTRPDSPMNRSTRPPGEARLQASSVRDPNVHPYCCARENESRLAYPPAPAVRWSTQGGRPSASSISAPRAHRRPDSGRRAAQARGAGIRLLRGARPTRDSRCSGKLRPISRRGCRACVTAAAVLIALSRAAGRAISPRGPCPPRRIAKAPWSRERESLEPRTAAEYTRSVRHDRFGLRTW